MLKFFIIEKLIFYSLLAIVHGPARLWRIEALEYIMKACIILHNMIIEDKHDANGAEDFDYDKVPKSIPATMSHEPTEEFSQFTTFTAAHGKIRNRETHFELQSNLVEHLWKTILRVVGSSNFKFYARINFYVFGCNLKFLFIYVSLVQVL